jgi:hypothetical protein
MLAITLFSSLLVLLALAPPSSANVVSPDAPHRRDHVNLNRMIKRRVPDSLIPRQQSSPDIPKVQAGAVGAAADPSAAAISSAAPSSASSAPASAASATSQAQSASQSPQAASSPVSSVSSSAVSCFLFFFFFEMFQGH